MKTASFLLVSIISLAAWAGSLPLLKYRALDDSGDAISGAKLYFYEAGTTTPLATYSDEALSSANANPVVADSSGWFGEIYMKTDEAYKVKLTDSADVQVWVVDDIYAGELVSASVSTRLKQVASNPVDYGALGNGVADEASEVQSAIDNATGIVDLLGKTYRCDSALTVTSHGITIRNGTLDFSNSTDDSYLTVQGSTGSAITLNANASVGDDEIDLTSITGISAGDWLYLYSSDIWGTGTNETVGELVQVESMGTDPYLTRPLEVAYATADSASVKEVSPIAAFGLENVRIVGSTGASGTGNLLLLDRVERSNIKGCSFDGAKASAIRVETSAGVSISDSRFENSAYGVTVAAFSRDIHLDRLDMQRITTAGVLIGPTGDDGVVKSVTVRDSTIADPNNGVFAEKMSQGVVLDGLDITGEETDLLTRAGVYIRGLDVAVLNSRIKRTGGSGIYVVPSVSYTGNAPWSYRIIGNQIENASVGGSQHGIHVAADASIGGVEIIGNLVTSTGRRGISISSNEAIIADNTIRDAGRKSIQLGIAAAVSDVQVRGNRIYNAPASYDGIDVYTGSSDVGIVGNTIEGQFTTGIDLTGTTGAVVASNHIKGTNSVASAFAIDVDTSADVSVVGNTIVGMDGASAAGISIDTVNQGVAVSGNHVADAPFGIYLTGSSTDLAISGNTLVDCGSGIDGAGSSGISNATISGNVITGIDGSGDNSIRIESGTFVAIIGNFLSRADALDDNILLDGQAPGTVTYIAVTGNVIEQGDYGIGEPTDANNLSIHNSGNVFRNITQAAPYEGTVTNDTYGDY